MVCGMFPIIRNGQDRSVLCQHRVENEDGTGLEYLTFPLLDSTGMVRHLFSTRLGGTSRGEFASMNLEIGRASCRERV